MEFCKAKIKIEGTAEKPFPCGLRSAFGAKRLFPRRNFPFPRGGNETPAYKHFFLSSFF
jgi:hypothetical protein